MIAGGQFLKISSGSVAARDIAHKLASLNLLQEVRAWNPR